MAKLVSLSLLALWCVTFVSCKSSSSSSSNPPAPNLKEFIQTTCQQLEGLAGEASNCTKELTPFASEIQGDMARLVMKAVLLSKDKTKSSIKLLKKLKLDKNATVDQAKAVDQCISNHVQSAQQIAWAEGSLKSFFGQHNHTNNNTYNLKSNTTNWLLNSTNSAIGCVSAMDDVKNDTFPGADAYNYLDGASTTLAYTWDAVGAYFQDLAAPPITGFQPLPATIDGDYVQGLDGTS